MFKGWKIFALAAVTLVVVVGLFLFLERPPSAAGLDPEEVITHGRDAFRNLDAFGRQEVTIYRDGIAVSTEEYPSPIEPWLKAKAVEMGIPQGTGKMIAYEFLSRLARKMDFDEEFFTTHDVSVIGARKIAGRWAWETEIKPGTPGNGYLRISFDKETGYPLERIKFDRNGQKENAICLTKIESFDKRPPQRFDGMPEQRPEHMPGPETGQRPDQKPDRWAEQRPDRPLHKPQNMRPGLERRFKHLMDNLEEHPPPGQGPAFKPQRFMPPEEFHRFLNKGKALYPTYIPEGHRFMGARLLPPGLLGNKEKLQLIFTDGVNVLSVFQIQLPPQSLAGGDIENYLRSKVEELHNSFPEGFALRRVEEGILVGVGDMDPEILDEVLRSMTQFRGDTPVWGDDTPLNTDELY